MSEQLGGWKRTGMCEDFYSRDIGKKVTLMGWVDSRRNLGGLIFVWLRDRSGIIQLVFDENDQTGDFSGAESLRAEFVIAVKGEEMCIRDRLWTAAYAAWRTWRWRKCSG